MDFIYGTELTLNPVTLSEGGLTSGLLAIDGNPPNNY